MVYRIQQGTVSGLILFIIYVNDLLNLGINCNTLAFADTVLYFERLRWTWTEKEKSELRTIGLLLVINWYFENS